MVKPWRFWVDSGGTFTDVIGMDGAGRLHALKLLSASEAYADPALEGMRRLLGLATEDPWPGEAVAEIRMGTTVATNALLQRNGARTLLVVTAGFADALLIGDQTRPDLFALDIRRPAPFYDRVIEADERRDAAGAVVRPLDETALAAALRTAQDEGLEAVAIAFLHADLDPAHEIRAGELARAAGFAHVTLSHEAAPGPRFIPRAETAVIDATLTPVLRARVAGLARATAPARLTFMTSAGGLADPQAFRGRDAILSGPAGGVAAIAALAARAGGRPVLGFDMGGTSTDVCRFAGALERRDEARFAGARVRAPTLDIHTVAAGGGSILSFRDGRAQAGPLSAGAAPGPAAYGLSGPATVTDANIVLGRLDPAGVPAIFGPGGDQPLDAKAARQAIGALAEAMGESDLAAAARGFLAVAVEHMAGAIARISTERGFDPRDHALIAFGGAAGQTACDVAEALGIDEVIVPPYASLLSAWGMGQARRRALRQAGIEAPLGEAGLETAIARAGELEALARSELAGVEVTVERRLRLRYAEADVALPVELGGAAGLKADFEAAHQRLFGFIEPEGALVIAGVEVEAVEVEATGTGPSAAVVGVAEGPRLIVQHDTQIWVAEGWRAETESDGLIRLRRRAAAVHAAPDASTSDPVTLELFNRRFMSIAEAMGAALERTARSVNIKERLDFSCALFDADGGLVANAPHMPVHLGSMGASVEAVKAAHPVLRRGDAFALNSPYAGGTHLPDITVVMPVFAEGDAAPGFFVAARGHHADVGGVQPGSMPPFSTRIEEEGALLEALPILREGRFQEEAARNSLTAGAWPARSVERNIADLKAQIAACEAGARAVLNLMARHGSEVVRAYMGHVQANAEACVRRAIRALRSGSAEMVMDGGAVLRVRLEVGAERGEATLDFRDSARQQASNFNAPEAVVRAAVLYAFRCLVREDIPLNAGCLKPLNILVSPGSMLSPRYPAAVVAGNVETSQHLVDLLFAAMGVSAAGQGTMNNLTFGDSEAQYYETICGGAGAGPDFDGASAVHIHMTNSRMTDPEILERRFPVRLEHFGVRRGSGGAGRHQGGDGAVRRLRFLAPLDLALLSSRRIHAPPGLAGGEDGAGGAQRIIRADGRTETLAGCFAARVGPGDVLELESPGGGGWG